MSENNVESPFEGQNKRIENTRGKKSQTKLYLIIAGVALCALAVGYFLMSNTGNDRYRTLESVQYNEVLDNHERLIGASFKIEGTVDAELGTEIAEGKLVTFRDPNSRDVLPILLSSSVLDGKILNKGQKYQMEVEVLRGGLVSAKHIQKQ